jgi:hypothetical protein
MADRVDKILERDERQCKQEANGKGMRKSSPPERVANFIRRVIRGEKFYPGPERRQSLRYPITMPVKSTPVTDHYELCGDVFLAVTRDISLGGLCMYHLAPVTARYLQLEITNNNDEHLSVLMEVVRCRQTGPFFEVAGRFIGQV